MRLIFYNSVYFKTHGFCSKISLRTILATWSHIKWFVKIRTNYHTELSECGPLGALLRFEPPDLVEFCVSCCIIIVASHLRFPFAEFFKVSFESPKPISFSKFELHDGCCVTAVETVWLLISLKWPVCIVFRLGNVYKLSSGGGKTISQVSSNEGDATDEGGGSNCVKDWLMS